ncbi:hypothetical protein ACFPN2_20935 [Steroidobacter flavus]|uniref:Uncharacterized protein n=1 Tax=Steroidobacter flavus TaxID=1842136 RepID=A0ABV8SYP8_9GAMM
MGRRTVRVIRPRGGGGVFAVEALLVGLIAGVALHEIFPEMHGALLLTLGIFSAIAFAMLVLKFVIIFWLWTAALAGGAGYGILRASSDLGWGLFWAAIAVPIIVGLHVSSRNRMKADEHENEDADEVIIVE